MFGGLDFWDILGVPLFKETSAKGCALLIGSGPSCGISKTIEIGSFPLRVTVHKA